MVPDADVVNRRLVLLQLRQVERVLGCMKSHFDPVQAAFGGRGSVHVQRRGRALARDRPRAAGDAEPVQRRAGARVHAPYGRALFLLSEGALFAPSFVGGAVRGMHGYDVDSPSAFAAVASDAPIPPGCNALTELAPWIRSLLGLAPDGARA